MTQPVRIQLSRKKGFNLQEHSRSINGLPAVNCARPGPWGNPFVVGSTVDEVQAKRWGWWPLDSPDRVAPNRTAAAIRFAGVLSLKEGAHDHIRRELRGKNLACWCPEGPCHCDALIRIANS